MQTLRLATIAAEAELLRLRRIARRTTFRVVYAAAAMMFIGAALGTTMVASVMFLATRVGLLHALWIAAAISLAIGAIFVLMAVYSKPDSVETEAQAVRDSAFRGMKQATSATAIAGDLIRRLLPIVSMWLLDRRK
jgi:hypothetical protein